MTVLGAVGDLALLACGVACFFILDREVRPHAYKSHSSGDDQLAPCPEKLSPEPATLGAPVSIQHAPIQDVIG